MLNVSLTDAKDTSNPRLDTDLEESKRSHNMHVVQGGA
jgi:hypothetical protein